MSTKDENRQEGHSVKERSRLPVAVLTVAGISLVVIGQAVYRAGIPSHFWHLALASLHFDLCWATALFYGQLVCRPSPIAFMDHHLSPTAS